MPQDWQRGGACLCIVLCAGLYVVASPTPVSEQQSAAAVPHDLPDRVLVAAEMRGCVVRSNGAACAFGKPRSVTMPAFYC